MTFERILHFMQTLQLHNVSIHIKFYQNRFINWQEKNQIKSRNLIVFCEMYKNLRS